MIRCIGSISGRRTCVSSTSRKSKQCLTFRLSHPFVERLIGTIRREFLDQTLFWTTADLEEKLRAFQHYFNQHRMHSGLEGRLPEPGEENAPLSFASYRWQQHCRGLYQTPIAA